MSEKDKKSRAWIFIRGLNTWGDNRLHLGPIGLSEFHDFLAPKLVSPTTSFLALEKLGAGSLKEVTDKASAEIRDRWSEIAGEDLEPSEEIYLLGHSMGGLVARALAHDPWVGSRIHGVVTLATPHHGTPLVRYAETQLETASWVGRLSRFAGYDLRDRIDFLREFDPDNMVEFNRQYPDSPSVYYGSIVAAPEPDERAVFFKAFDRVLGEHHDGLVPKTSQYWGEVLGEFRLDHYGILGLFLLLQPHLRANAGVEFQKVIETIRTSGRPD